MIGSSAPASQRAIGLGLAIGLLAGLAANRGAGSSPELDWLVANVTQVVGSLFLRLLLMIVIPLVFTSLVLGIGSFDNARRVGGAWATVLARFVVLAALGSTLGASLGVVLLPDQALDPMLRQRALFGAQGVPASRLGPSREAVGLGAITSLVPANPVDAAARGDMLGVIIFTLLFGLALSGLPRTVTAPLLRVARGAHEALGRMITFTMRLAPVGVCALTFSSAARLGLDLLRPFGLYLGVLLLGLAILQVALWPLAARALAGVPVGRFLRGCWKPAVMAFATGSSQATLPTTLRAAESELAVPAGMAAFVVNVGASMSRAGTALFQSLTVVFLVRAFGLGFGLAEYAVTVATCALAALAVAGIPSGAIPLLAAVLPVVGLPADAIGLIVGVDPVTSMARTVPNVTGALLVSLTAARTERIPELARGPADAFASETEQDPSNTHAREGIGRFVS